MTFRHEVKQQKVYYLNLCMKKEQKNKEKSNIQNKTRHNSRAGHGGHDKETDQFHRMHREMQEPGHFGQDDQIKKERSQCGDCIAKKEERGHFGQRKNLGRVHSRLGYGSWLAWLVALSLVSPIQSACHVDNRWSDFSDECTLDGLPMASFTPDELGMITHGTRVRPGTSNATMPVASEPFAVAVTQLGIAAAEWCGFIAETCNAHITMSTAPWILAAVGDMLWFGVFLLVKTRHRRNPKQPRIGFSKYRKVHAATFQEMKRWQGPWKQAFRKILTPRTFLCAARIAGRQRVPGVKGLRGLGNHWRTSPFRTAASKDCLTVRRCVAYLQSRKFFAYSPRAACHDSSYATSDQLDSKFLLEQLAGGMAGGAHATQRKRKAKQQNDSLADALGSFLAQWNNKNKQRKSDIPQSRSNQNGSSASRDGADQESLLQGLLHILKECSHEQHDDNVVLQKVQNHLTTWQKRGSQWDKNETWNKSQQWSYSQGYDQTQWYSQWEMPQEKKQKPAVWEPQTWPSLKARPTEAPISGLNDAEWSMPVKIEKKGKVMQTLLDGQEPAANLIIVQTHEDFVEIRDLCKALRVWPHITVLVIDTSNADGGKLIKVATKCGPGHLKPKTFFMHHLSSARECPTPTEPIRVNLEKFRPPAKTTIRITAPSHYRKAFLQDFDHDNVKLVIAELATWQKGPASALTGGTWAWKTVGSHDQLIGHLRVHPDLAKDLTAQSGTKGIFVTETQVHQRAEKIRWISRNKENGIPDDPEVYFAAAMEFAKKRNQGLKFRVGGGNDLGVIAGKNETWETQAITAAATGIPLAWEATDLQGFMQEQGWTQLDVLTRRRQGRHAKWIFRAFPPNADKVAGSVNPTWYYEDSQDSTLQIFVCKAPHRPSKHVEMVPVKPLKRSFRNMPTITLEPTRSMVEDQGERVETKPPQNEKPTDSKRDRSRSPAKAAPRPVIPRTFDEVAEALSAGWEEKDLGGSGDCGFRSLAAAIEYSESGQQLDAEKARLAGAGLRVKAVAHLRKHKKDYIDFVAKDSNTSPEGNAPDIEAEWQTYVEDMTMPDTWIDGVVLMALSTRLGLPIIIWKMLENGWQRTTIAPKFRDDIAWEKPDVDPLCCY